MPQRSDKVEAAARTLQLLEELNRHHVAPLDKLHKATALPKSTIVRLLKSLCAMGYVANDRRQGGYAVTSRVKSLSNGFHGDPLVVEAARPWAIAFTRQHQWPVAIAVRDGMSVAVRFSTIPDSPVSPFHATLNMRLSLLGRGLGRAYIAFCSPGERSELLDLLQKKAKGKPLPEPKEDEGGEVVDLMEALRQSVAATQKRAKPKAKRKAAPHKAAAKRKAS